MAPALREAAHSAAPARICAEPDANMCVAWKAYVHAVSKLRASIADVLEALELRGLGEETLVVLYSDHGEEFLDHQDPQRARATNPRKLQGFGHGHAMYDELLRVPLVLWDPGHPGADHERSVSLVDVVPSVAARLGLGVDPDWEGSRLDERQAGDESPIFASAMAVGPEETVVVRGRWKRIERTRPEERVLFDLASDPREVDHATRDDVAAELDALIRGYREGSRAPEAEAVRLPARDVEALQALGYLGDAEAEP
jgi:arylsulfatase A-like enzyme